MRKSNYPVTQQAAACKCHQTDQETARRADCPAHGTAALQARMQRARRTRHQARLVQDGRVIASGPWRSDHLAAVCDRTRIWEYQTDHGVAGQAQIASMALGVVS